MSTHTTTPIDLYVGETTRRLEQHNDPRQLAVILRDLHELAGVINGEITEDHLDQIKAALTVSLGHGWTHLAEWEPSGNSDSEGMTSPIDNLVEVMSELGTTHARLVFGEPDENVGHFLELGKWMEIVHRYTNEADEQVVDQPVERLTVQAIEEARTHLTPEIYAAIGIMFDLTIYQVAWTFERRLPGHTSGDPIDILYVFGDERDEINATLNITSETRVSEANGQLIVENCKMFVRLLEIFDYGEVSDEMSKAVWREIFTDTHVTRLVINQETSKVESFDIQGYNN